MAEKTNARPPTELAQRREWNRGLVQSHFRKLMEFLPDQRQADYFRGMLLAMVTQPNLADCTVPSLMVAAANSCKLGLVPDNTLGQLYVVPFKNKGKKEATIIIGYRGYVELARRTGLVGSINTAIVYARDVFDYEEGSSPRVTHRPWWKSNPPPDDATEGKLADLSGAPIAVYCRAQIVSPTGYALGDPQTLVLPRHEVLKYKARSRARNDGPWVTDELAMWRKTAVRRAKDLWPATPLLARASDLDERADREDATQVDRETLADIMPEGAGADAPDGRSGFGFSSQPEAAADDEGGPGDGNG